MNYRHSMACHTEGIRQTTPVRWRDLDGLVGVYWQAEGQAGAKGYYLSPDPRIVLFFNDVSDHIRMSNDAWGARWPCRSMARAIYVPAGVPLWTCFTARHSFSHLDLHIHRDRMMRYLAPSVGRSTALAALRRPVEIQQVAPIEPLAGLLVDELSGPGRHAIYGESLVGGIVAGLLDLSDHDDDRAIGGLTQAQMNRLTARVHASADRRMTVAEMADVVGLSESWFSHAFKKTTGKTPLQWLLGQRIELAQILLAETGMTVAAIAAQLGFSDQAHLTRVFRQVSGETPAAWRRVYRA